MSEEVFRALADRHRRLLLDRLRERDGQTLRELCAGLDVTRQAVTKHLAVLEAAGLVATTRHGREKRHHLDSAPIDEVAARWIGRYARPRVQASTELKTALEAAVSETEFVYTTYIHTTPEQLWRALTEPAFTRRYWGVEFTTDWRAGAPMTWVENGRETVDPEQVVLEADPPRRLAYTWHTVTPEWAEAAGIDAETLARLGAERRSKVTFDLDVEGDVVRLRVVHSDLGETIAAMVAEGWPRLVSELKTLLETTDR
ncbi:ArsR/SmtB family transcription factor [Pseudonocardia xishanensis]|uniref:Metalloregulator ArsR/SmtB family transcription factor n=1 Tax=Pseudonocardia xishanensis TaxID=630995 RepID=A0ABP8RND2_9PSEU